MAFNQTQNHLPMYFRIQQSVLEQIQNGNLVPGEQLPSEAELAQKYQVSRITAKRALDELVRMGRAFRQQGRGTFVAQARIREISGFRSFSEDIRERGLRPSSVVLNLSEIIPEQVTRDRLHILEGNWFFSSSAYVWQMMNRWQWRQQLSLVPFVLG